MKTLSYLNGISTTSVSYTDTRDPDVIFDRTAPKDYNFTGTDTSFNVKVGINIIEIIKPISANVRYEIDVGTINATVSWDTIPVGCFVTQAGSKYIMNGIDSVEDWNYVKSPLITLDTGFFGTVNYSAAIVYDKIAAPNTIVKWNIGQYVPEALLPMEASITATAEKFYGIILNLPVYATMGRINAILAVVVNMESSSSFVAEGQLVTPFSANLQVAGAQLTATTVDYDSFNQSYNITSSMDISATKYTGITNIGNRDYLSNQLNDIFAITTPFIEDTGESSTYKIEFVVTGPGGNFSDENDVLSTTYSFTGTVSECNNKFLDIVFWPDPGNTSNVSWRYNQYKDSILVISNDYTMNYGGAGSIDTNVYTFTSNSTWTPSVEELTYGKLDYLVVGGGGATSSEGNADFASGGGGGEVLEGTDVVFSNQTYTITVGTGGTGSVGGDGNSGGTSSFGAIIANGGEGGKAGNYSQIPGEGGDDGSGTYVGGTGFYNITQYSYWGGGGAGATGDGGNAGYASGGGDGGPGYISNISGTSIEYAHGGGGSALSGWGGAGDTLTTPGSGGCNGTSVGGDPGYDGIVILKTYP